MFILPLMGGGATARDKNGGVSTETVQIFTALLAVGVLAAGVVALVSLAVLARPSWAQVRWARSYVSLLAEVGPWAIAAVATGAMVGSLYFSEVAGFAPCELCWYQRIGIYPVAIASWVALVRREWVLGPYVIALSIAGLCVSVYHYLLEWFPEIKSSVCSVDVPCTTVWFRELGFVTLAFMAGSAFVFLIAASWVMMKHPTDTEE